MRKNSYERTVRGIGYLGYFSDGTPAKVVDESGKVLREYKHWYSMINRCYNKEVHKTHPSYAECKVAEEWLEFAYFYEHFSEIEGYEEWLKFPNKKWHLDKDIKIKGNKIYSIENCCLVEDSINVREVNERLGNPNIYINKNWVIGLSIKDEQIVLYESPIRAEEELGIDSSSIRKAYKGQQRSANGFQWVQITEEEYKFYKDENLTASEIREIKGIKPYTRRLTKETKKKQMNVHWSKTGSYHPPGKKVVCLNYPDIIFESAALASKWCKGSVKTNCQGRSNTAGKHPETGEKLKWMYYDEWILQNNNNDVALQ